jgi:hypothetical protein
MENNQIDNQEAANKVYAYAANLLINEKKDSYEVKNMLVEKGLDAQSADTILNNLENEISKAKKDRANKDMIYGALWCVGGIILTAAHIGFIFWGAILFGGIQFIKGLVNALSDQD